MQNHLNSNLRIIIDFTIAAKWKQRAAEKQQHQSILRSKNVLIHSDCLKEKNHEIEDKLSSLPITNTDLEQEIYNLELVFTVASNAIDDVCILHFRK